MFGETVIVDSTPFVARGVARGVNNFKRLDFRGHGQVAPLGCCAVQASQRTSVWPNDGASRGEGARYRRRGGTTSMPVNACQGAVNRRSHLASEVLFCGHCEWGAGVRRVKRRRYFARTWGRKRVCQTVSECHSDQPSACRVCCSSSARGRREYISPNPPHGLAKELWRPTKR